MSNTEQFQEKERKKERKPDRVSTEYSFTSLKFFSCEFLCLWYYKFFKCSDRAGHLYIIFIVSIEHNFIDFLKIIDICFFVMRK